MDDIKRIVAARHCGHKWPEIHSALRPQDNTIGGVRGAYIRRDKKKYPKGEMPVPCPICNPESYSFRETGNYAEATLIASSVQSPDEMLRYLEQRGQNLDEWQIKDWDIKFWEVGAKIKRGALTWTEGKLDGHLSYEGLGKENLRSIWVRFIRKNPIPILPTIQPMNSAFRFSFPDPRPIGTASKTLIITDIHFGFRKRMRDAKLIPFHDRRVLELAYQIAAIEKPSCILFVGDTADCADWSDSFTKEPSFYFTTQPMIIEVHWWLTRFRRLLPDAKIIMHQGNHSNRVPRAILNHLVAAYGLRAADELDMPPQLSLPRLFALHQLGIVWVDDYPNDDYWLTDTIRSQHGNKASSVSGATARKMLDTGVSTIYGHDHLKALLWNVISERNGPRPIFAYNCGCACHVDGRVPGHNRDQNWQQGFGMLEEHCGAATITDAQVYNGRLVWRGQLFEAGEDVSELISEFPDWNW